eukprot:403364229
MGLGLDKCCQGRDINIINNYEYINVNYVNRAKRPEKMGKKDNTMYEENSDQFHISVDRSHSYFTKLKQNGTGSFYKRRQDYFEIQEQHLNGRICFQDIEQIYDIGKNLGSGRFGVVNMIEKKSYPKKKFACKKVDRDRVNSEIGMLERELDILMKVDHPNIINFHEIYMDQNYFHFVTQLCEGGELFQHLENGRFSEQIAAKIVQQILSAIKHLHDHGICHRDLKLENIMFENYNYSKDPMIKVIDFGLAQYFNSSDQFTMNSQTGTPYYMAPEVIDGQYDESCDMWAIGVIAYSLLAAYPPFNADSHAQLFRKIKVCDYEFHKETWSDISDDAKKFISQCLQQKSSYRLKPQEGLKHPWIVKNTMNEGLDLQIFETLKKAKKFNKFQQHILEIMVSLLASKDISYIKNAFNKFDKDFSGTINQQEFNETFKLFQPDMREEEINEIFDRIKNEVQNEITWSDFLYACLDKKILTMRKLKSVFKFLDSDEMNFLTFSSLKDSFMRRGHKFVDSNEIEQMLLEVRIIDPEDQVSSLSQGPISTDQNDITVQDVETYTKINFKTFCHILGFESCLEHSDSSSNASASTQNETQYSRRDRSSFNYNAQRDLVLQHQSSQQDQDI